MEIIDVINIPEEEPEEDPTEESLADRYSIIRAMILQGEATSKIKQYSMKRWGVSLRTVATYLKICREGIKGEIQELIDPKEVICQNYYRYLQIFKRAMIDNDGRLAIEALKGVERVAGITAALEIKAEIMPQNTVVILPSNGRNQKQVEQPNAEPQA